MNFARLSGQGLACSICLLCLVAASAAGPVKTQPPFGQVESAVPVPPSELAIEAVEAAPVRIVASNGQTLEGAMFDPNGDLLFCNVSDSKVMRLTPAGDLSEVVTVQGFAPGGLARHPDGRLFIAGINQARRNGAIVALAQDGSGAEVILGPDQGFMPNDLVFDHSGGIYFTDFNGSATNPAGGVYYLSPDFRTITPVIPNMCQANGIALSPDGKTLWATEYAANRLHRVNLAGPSEVPLTGSKILYHFTGPAPDSMRVDRDGNVYVALVGQGRVLIFNPAGMPIGQVLLPGRDKGLNLRSTSLALHPQKNEMRIVSGNTTEADAKEAMIFSGPAFGPAIAR